jgi:hypothetical protein
MGTSLVPKNRHVASTGMAPILRYLVSHIDNQEFGPEPDKKLAEILVCLRKIHVSTGWLPVSWSHRNNGQRSGHQKAVDRDRGKPCGSPLPHHRAYGSVPRRFGRVKRAREPPISEGQASRNTRSTALAGLPHGVPCARPQTKRRRPPPHGGEARPTDAVVRNGCAPSSIVARRPYAVMASLAGCFYNWPLAILPHS